MDELQVRQALLSQGEILFKSFQRKTFLRVSSTPPSKGRVEAFPYADDAYYFLKDITSLQTYFSYSQTLRSFRSLKIYLHKCEACWIGASKFNIDKPLGCSWVSLTNGSIRVPGNVMSYNNLIAHQVNFLNIIPTV